MTELEVIERVDETVKVKIPSMYKVIMHNDDETTMEFVISVLVEIFHKTTDEAVVIMQAIHETGQGIAGAPYTLEVAVEKTLESTGFARANGFPLKVTYEEL